MVHPQPPGYTNMISPTDVLCGRGAATNNHPGNVAFRALVKEYQERYIHANRKVKAAVVELVVYLIRERGGRFLLRDRDTGLWVDVGDLAARGKTSQAMREGAPEIRKRKTDVSIQGRDQKLKGTDNDNEERGRTWNCWSHQKTSSKLSVRSDPNDDHASKENKASYAVNLILRALTAHDQQQEKFIGPDDGEKQETSELANQLKGNRDSDDTRHTDTPRRNSVSSLPTNPSRPIPKSQMGTNKDNTNARTAEETCATHNETKKRRTTSQGASSSKKEKKV